MIEIDGCSGGYGSGDVLRNVSLSVRSGEVLALVGPNGAGKSTLVRALVGLLPDVRGAVRLDGTDVGRLSGRDRVRAGIAHVPEGRGVFGRLSVAENLRLGTASRRGAAAATSEAYDLFPVLGDRRSQPAGTLSGGEQQMLAIARALVGKPRYLVVDEPSLGLAPKLVDEMFASVKAIAADRQLGVLLAEQDSRLRKVADEVVVIVSGAIVARGGPDILSRPDELFALYRGERTDLTGSRVERGPGTHDSHDIHDIHDDDSGEVKHA